MNNRIVEEQTGLIQPPGVIGPGNSWVSVRETETHRFTYDQNGQKSSSTDSRGVTNYTYDNRNRLETTTEPKRQDQQAYPVTRLEYDRTGNKTKVTFPDMTTQRWEDYDPFGQPRKFFNEYENPTDLTYQWGPMKKLDTVRTYREKDGPPGGTETQETRRKGRRRGQSVNLDKLVSTARVAATIKKIEGNISTVRKFLKDHNGD